MSKKTVQTLEDIARLAKVSTSTVSRALNDSPLLNQETKARIQAIQERGKRVPEEIAVIGYDDLSIASYNNLPLTTVRQNIPLAGKLLAQNLIQYLQTGVITNVTTPVELVIRKSA